MLRSIRNFVHRIRAKLSFGQQIAIMAGLLSFILVVAVALFAGDVARRQSIGRIETSMNSLAASMADRLDLYMLDRYRSVGDVAAFQPLREMWTRDPGDVRAVLEQMQKSFPAYTWIGFARPDGTVVAATGGLLEGASVAERPWFRHALLAPTVEDLHDAKLLASLLPAQASGEPFRFVDVAVPIKDPVLGTIGVLGAHLSWSWANDIRKLVLSRLDPKLRTDIWILTADGSAMLGPAYGDKPFDAAIIDEVARKGRVTFIDDGVLTSAYLKAGERVPSLPNWIVVARRPLAIAYAEANAISGQIGLAGLLLGGLGVIAAMIAGGRISKPLRNLTNRLDLIGRDPNYTTVRREHGSREVVQLTSALRSLLLRVATAEEQEVEARRSADTAEQRMEERTRTLGEHIRTLQTLADTDSLTGLLNRRAFLVFATDAMNYFKRHERPIGIFIIDIDFFKRVNDTYGHAFGDVVIEVVAKTIQAQVRTTDKVARFGGEEFVVLLRETDAEGALSLAERIRETIAANLLENEQHDTVHVTVSIGVAMARTSDRDVEDVVERADRALYRAKQTGRNRVVADVDGEAMPEAAE